MTLGSGQTINLFQQNMFAVRAEIEVGFRADTSVFNKLTATVTGATGATGAQDNRGVIYEECQVGVPTFENITPDTFKSIYGLERGGHKCIFEFVRGYDCATARNRIAQMSLDKGVDYVLMVDNDVALPKGCTS